MAGGRVIPGDLTVRNANGWPIDTATGEIDKATATNEANVYYRRVHTLQGSKKAKNFTPPKKKRK